MIFYLVMALFFICMQGFFAGMETGMVSVMRPRAEHAAKTGRKSAKIMVFFLQNPGIMIATALIGVNISVVMASLMTKKFIECFHLSGSLTLFLASSVLSVILLACEIVPKNWFREAPFDRCSIFIRVFYGAYLLLFIPVRIFSKITDYLNSLAAKLQKNGEEKPPGVVVRENFRLYLRESQSSGALDDATASIIDKAIDIPGMLIQNIMSPANMVHDIPSDMTIRQAFDFCNRRGETKIPIYPAKYSRKKDEFREWCGIFNLYDAIYSIDEALWDATPVSACARPLDFISDNLKLGELIEKMRFRRILFFVVLDGNKRQCGIVKPEDLASLLFE